MLWIGIDARRSSSSAFNCLSFSSPAFCGSLAMSASCYNNTHAAASGAMPFLIALRRPITEGLARNARM
jgi:hypothetical protein